MEKKYGANRIAGEEFLKANAKKDSVKVTPSGLQYKALNLKERLGAMSENEQFALLASDGMLVKRPLLVQEGKVLVGFRPEEWEKTFPG